MMLTRASRGTLTSDAFDGILFIFMVFYFVTSFFVGYRIFCRWDAVFVVVVVVGGGDEMRWIRRTPVLTCTSVNLYFWFVDGNNVISQDLLSDSLDLEKLFLFLKIKIVKFAEEFLRSCIHITNSQIKQF